MDHKVLSIALEGMYSVDHKVLCNTDDDKVILKCGPQSPVYSIRGYVYV